jgi:hypothetical protein
MTPLLHQLETGDLSAEEVQKQLDEKIIACYESFQRMAIPMTNDPLINMTTKGMFQLFKLHFAEDLERLGLEI